MPNMGIGLLGDPKTIIKRKFRFTIEFETPCGNVPRHFVKMASRPQLDTDELELNFLNGVSWIPGKSRWQPLSVTYVDVAHSEMIGLYRWVSTVYDFNQAERGHLPQSEKAGWSGTGIIRMYDGCGDELERWTLGSCWPQSINFGETDYGASEEATIELTVRFSEAKLEFAGCTGMGPVQGCCRGCGSSGSNSLGNQFALGSGPQLLAS